MFCREWDGAVLGVEKHPLAVLPGEYAVGVIGIDEAVEASVGGADALPAIL